MPRKRIAHVGRQVWANLAVIALLFSIVPGTYLYVQNRHRISDIQKSRVSSCKFTYEGVREVFRPFFRPEKLRTPKEQSDIEKFNRTVDGLKSKCEKQISTKGE